MSKKYYRLDNILKCKARWNILYGMRANGKSYAVKERALKRAYENGEQFVYLRRWSEDIKVNAVKAYFEDMPVNRITKGEYDGVTAYQGNIYFCTYDEKGNTVKAGEPIGRYCSLNQAERYKSQAFPKVKRILFEEFITNRIYLGSTATGSEAKILMQFVSTVARDEDIEVFLIGNTISRTCPYFAEWGILKGIMKQSPGTIDIYHLRGENGIVDIAVENCEVIETKSKMFFGLASKQITSGEWDVDEVPKLLKPYAYYDMLYELRIVFAEFKYIMQLLYDGESGGTFVYIYPDTGVKRKIRRVITNIFNVDPFITNGLRGDIKAEALIAECFRKGKVCFSDNLTGTDFKNVLNNYDLKGVII